MNYPENLCRLVINNMDIIEEAPRLVEQVEKRLFAAVNERVQKRVSAQGGWKGCYELYTGKKDETYFAPAGWPKDDQGEYLAYYGIGCSAEGEDYNWLSCATGVGGTALNLQFGLDREYSRLSAKDQRKLLNDFYTDTPVLHEAGFQNTKSGSIHRPFAFDAVKLAEEFPDFEEALAPLDKALEDLFKAHSEFNNFVSKLKPK